MFFTRLSNIFYLILIVLSFILFSTSCNKNKGKTQRVSINELKEQYLEVDTLFMLREYYAPEIHMITDSMILITNYRNGGDLRVYYTNRDSTERYYLKSVGSKEVITQNLNVNEQFSVYNSNFNTLFDYVIRNGILSINKYSRLKIEENTPYNAVRMEDGKLIGLGNFSKGLFSVLDPETRIINFFGNYPLKGSRFYDLDYVENYVGYMSENDNTIIYASRFFGYISSYKYNKGKLKKSWEKQLSDFSVTPRLSRLELGEDHQYGFQGVRTGKNNIYTIYSGYSRGSSKRGFTNSLLIFDKKGNPVANYQLPVMLSHFAIDSNEKYIYGTITGAYVIRITIPEKHIKK